MYRLNCFGILSIFFAVSMLTGCGDSGKSDTAKDASQTADADKNSNRADAGTDASNNPPSIIDWSHNVGKKALALAPGADGSMWVAGSTKDSLEGSNAGYEDAFVRQLSADGEVLKTYQFGTGGEDDAMGIAVDADGNLWVAGAVEGDLETLERKGGEHQAYLRKYSADGEVAWTHPFGSANSSVIAKRNNRANAVAVNAAGEAFVVGTTMRQLEDNMTGKDGPFIRKFSPDGDVIWTHQFGGADANGVALDADGNPWVIVWTESYGAAVYKFSTENGEKILSRELPPEDGYKDIQATAIRILDENIFITTTATEIPENEFSGRTEEGFVGKYDAQGNNVWIRAYGSYTFSPMTSVDIDADGNIWVAGTTKNGGDSGGQLTTPVIFVQKYDPTGELLIDEKPVGANEGNKPPIIRLNNEGDVFLAGQGNGNNDDGAFIRKLTL